MRIRILVKMLEYIRRMARQLACPHDWIERKPTPTEAQVYTVGYRFWLCGICGKKTAREWNDVPISYRASAPPSTEHYDSLREGLESYFRDFEYKTPQDCMAHILYDLMIWERGHVPGKMIDAFKEAHMMHREYYEREMRLLGETHKHV